jgi:guanylate kinase
MKITVKRKSSAKATPEFKEPTNVDSKSWTVISQKGKLFVFTGPSGSGKTTLAQSVLKEYDFFQRVVTCTTRAPREGEVNGKDYHFVSKEKFLDFIAQGALLEYATVYDNYYGSLKAEVEKVIESGKSVLLVVDVQGALTIKQKFPSAVNIFIKTPSLSILKKRLIMRGTDSMAVIDKRMQTAKEELKLENKFDYVVVNADLQKAIDEVKLIVKKSLS